MFNMDDPKIQMQLAMAAGLLSPVRGKGMKGFGEALSQGLLGGLRGYNVADEAQRRNQSVDMQNKMQQAQYDQMQGGLLKQKQIEGLAPQFFQPGNAPADGMGPVLPPKQDFGGYAQAVTGIDPMKGMALQAQLAQMNQKERVSVKPGETLGTWNGGQFVPSYSAPEKSKFQAGDTRELKSGRRVFTQEYDGKAWKTIGESSMDAPDKPDKPQLLETPNGPMWVTPPGRGSGAMPVMDPSGKPIPGKKRDQPLTESQARGTLFLGQMREAEEAIKNVKGFDPTSSGGQSSIAAALAAKEAGTLPGAALNIYAGPAAQQYAQGAEQWAESFLRLKTGAASTRDEVLRNVRTFFPQPGDSREVIKQKNEARATATKQMEIIAGHGTQQLDAQKPQASSVDDLLKKYLTK